MPFNTNSKQDTGPRYFKNYTTCLKASYMRISSAAVQWLTKPLLSVTKETSAIRRKLNKKVVC